MQEKFGKRAAEDDIFSGFKKKKGEGEGKSAMIPREEVSNLTKYEDILKYTVLNVTSDGGSVTVKS